MYWKWPESTVLNFLFPFPDVRSISSNESGSYDVLFSQIQTNPAARGDLIQKECICEVGIKKMKNRIFIRFSPRHPTTCQKLPVDI